MRLYLIRYSRIKLIKSLVNTDSLFESELIIFFLYSFSFFSKLINTICVDVIMLKRLWNFIHLWEVVVIVVLDTRCSLLDILHLFHMLKIAIPRAISIGKNAIRMDFIENIFLVAHQMKNLVCSIGFFENQKSIRGDFHQFIDKYGFNYENNEMSIDEFILMIRIYGSYSGDNPLHQLTIHRIYKMKYHAPQTCRCVSYAANR